MLDRLRSPGAGRAFLWISSLVLIAGVIAFATVRLGGDDGGRNAQGTSPMSEEEIDAAIDGATSTTPPPVSKVPKEARTAAGAFILAAAGREDLQKAWQLSHPSLREECGCTYKQWLTGNIPVQPFPTAGLQGVSYFVDELAPRRVVLQVLLRPAAGSDLDDQAFHIGLKAVGNGKDLAWLVDLWSPISPVPVPQG